MADAGDFTYPVGDPEYFTAQLEMAAEQILRQGKTLLGLGGDHFVTLPLLRAHAKIHGKMVGFLPGDLSQKIDPYLRPLYDALRLHSQWRHFYTRAYLISS